jgi:hypothetical protein
MTAQGAGGWFGRLSLRGALLAAATAVAVGVLATPAGATPIFAERYGFKCTQCHTAVPELNPFGEHFRRAGFRLPNVPQHHVIPIALRVQDVYNEEVAPTQPRRFNALAVAMSTANFGRDDQDSYFVRYFFGAQTAPGSLYYAWVQHVAPANGDFVKLGLYQLPLIANPTQRLDTITAQPAYTYTVAQNDANLATPRWGALFGQRNDRDDIELSVAFDEYHGAAYGAPAPPSDLAQSFGRPEIFGSATFAVDPELSAGILGLNGKRDFVSRTTGESYSDVFYRDGLQAQWTSPSRLFSLTGQQIFGHDDNSDGFGTPATSSGGFLTFKYRPRHNAYVGVRYDAAAHPFATRDYDFYAVWAPTMHSRLVIEHVSPLGTNGVGRQNNAELLFALPFAK